MTKLEIINLTKKLNFYMYQPPIILCIGSSRVSGDSLGPTVGEILTKIFHVPTVVYGTLSRPVNAVNLCTTLDFISRFHKNAEILAIDAGVGKSARGNICVKKEGIFPGAADGKILPKVGNVSITAAVCQKIEDIEKVDKSFIITLSYGISKAISEMEAFAVLKHVETLSQFDSFSTALTHTSL